MKNFIKKWYSVLILGGALGYFTGCIVYNIFSNL